MERGVGGHQCEAQVYDRGSSCATYRQCKNWTGSPSKSFCGLHHNRSGILPWPTLCPDGAQTLATCRGQVAQLQDRILRRQDGEQLQTELTACRQLHGERVTNLRKAHALEMSNQATIHERKQQHDQLKLIAGKEGCKTCLSCNTDYTMSQRALEACREEVKQLQDRLLSCQTERTAHVERVTDLQKAHALEMSNQATIHERKQQQVLDQLKLIAGKDGCKTCVSCNTDYTMSQRAVEACREEVKQLQDRLLPCQTERTAHVERVTNLQKAHALEMSNQAQAYEQQSQLNRLHDLEMERKEGMSDNTMSTDYDMSQQALHACREEVTQLRDAINERDIQHVENQKSIDRYQQQTETFHVQTASLQNELRRCRGVVERITKVQQAHALDGTQRQQMCQLLDERVTRQQTDLVARDQRIRVLVAQAQEFTGKHMELQKEFDQIQQRFDKCSTALIVAKGRLKELEVEAETFAPFDTNVRLRLELGACNDALRRQRVELRESAANRVRDID
jgi:hypothetical protein